MADQFTLVDPKGWEYDLHSVYSAYIGYFQTYNIPWYDRSWGHLFETFEEFLVFSWPVITVTDARTGKGHIVTRLNSIGAFLKMIKTRFGETIPQAPNILQITPFETSNRHLRHVSDYVSYKKLHSTLPAIALSAFRTRVRAGNVQAIREVWDKKDKTYLAIDFEWNERNEKTVLEWGYAAVRCGHLETLGHWPPVPDANYRKGHYIVADYVDKVVNKHCPTYPWQYAFGDSTVVPKAKLPQIIQAVISSLASPDSETTTNNLVLVAHGMHGDLARLEEMKIKLPHNMLVIDTATYERNLYSAGMRPLMVDPKNPEKPRTPGSTLSFENLLYSLTIPISTSSKSGSNSNSNSSSSSIDSGIAGLDKDKPSNGKRLSAHPPSSQLQMTPPLILPKCTLHNSGNDAFMCLFALQKLLEPIGTQAPTVTKKSKLGSGGAVLMSPNMINSGSYGMNVNQMAMGMMPTGLPMTSSMGMGSGMSMQMGMQMPMVASYGMSVIGSPPAVPSIYMNGIPGTPPLPPTTNPNQRERKVSTFGLSVPGTPAMGRRTSAYDLAEEFGGMNVGNMKRNGAGGGQHYMTSPSKLGNGRR